MGFKSTMVVATAFLASLTNAIADCTKSDYVKKNKCGGVSCSDNSEC